MLFVSVIPGLVDARVRHVNAYPFPMGGREGVGGMDPAVGVEHVFGYFFGVHAHDGGTDVLAGGDDEREGQKGHHRHPVV